MQLKNKKFQTQTDYTTNDENQCYSLDCWGQALCRMAGWQVDIYPRCKSLCHTREKNKNLLLYVNKNNQDRKLISSLRERYLY